MHFVENSAFDLTKKKKKNAIDKILKILQKSDYAG
jgi:hypothetical protein